MQLKSLWNSLLIVFFVCACGASEHQQPMLSSECQGDASSDESCPSADGGSSDGPPASSMGGNGGSGVGIGTGGSSGAGAGAVSGSGGTGGMEPEPPALGPAVEVTADAQGTLRFRSGEQVCYIDDNQDLSCMSLDGFLMLREAGPFASLALYGRSGISVGSEIALRTDGTIVNLLEGDSEVLCAPGPECILDGRAPEGEHIAISAGDGFGCAIRADGSLVCWGDNDEGAATPPAGNDFVGIDTEGQLSCALRANGEVTCWGNVFFMNGQPPGPATQVVVGEQVMCALLEGGGVFCDGFDNPGYGVPSNAQLARLSLDGSGLCGLTVDGAIDCWGTAYVERIAPLPGPYLQSVSNTFNVCGLRGDGMVECWGDDWGNGGGHETCKLTEARLTRAGAMEQQLYASEVAWGTNIGLGSIWSFATHLESIDPAGEHVFGPFVSIMGETLGTPNSDPRMTFEDGSPQPLARSLWALDATTAAMGTLLCTGPGSGSTVTRNGDELVFDVKDLAVLGACPGTPVTGELTWCSDFSCESNVSGSIQWTNWTVAASNRGESYLRLDDGSVLEHNGSSGLLITSSGSPFSGQVFCIGTVETNGSLQTFRELSALGACPTDGTASLTGCVR